MQTEPRDSEKRLDGALKAQSSATTDVFEYPRGFRLHTITVGLLLAMWLAQMESTITSTSIVTITNDLGGYIRNSWVLTAYWLTSGALQIVIAKLSDIYGRKHTILASLFLFTVFSGACGGSQTVFQLIMFRWLQGLGGSGIMALGQLLFLELVPPQLVPRYIGIVTAVLALPLVTGPLIGGGITVHGDWRWVFLVNVPVGALIFVTFIFVFPRKLSKEPANRQETRSIQSLRRVDLVGSTLLLGTCVLLITGLQQAIIYDFQSAYVLPLLVCTVPMLIGFFTSQWYLTTRQSITEPVFAWRFCIDRVQASLFLITLLNGGVLSICVVQIPQRFMAVNGMSAFSAAAKLLAFGVLVPIGSAVALTMVNKVGVRPSVMLATGAVFQLSGCIPLSQAPTSHQVEPWQYVCQALIGIGVGCIIPIVVHMIPHVMEERDMAVAVAAQSQFRTLGGLIAVSIGATIATRYLRIRVQALLPPPLAAMLLEKTETISMLSGTTLEEVRAVFGRAYNQEMYLAIGLAACCLPLAAMSWRVTKPNEGTVSTSQASPGDRFITEAEI